MAGEIEGLPANLLLFCILQIRIFLHVPVDMREQPTFTFVLKVKACTLVEVEHELCPLCIVGVGQAVDHEAELAAGVQFKLAPETNTVGVRHCTIAVWVGL